MDESKVKLVKELYIVGKIKPDNYNEWEFMGVFDHEPMAVQQCMDENYFVGPCRLNEALPQETIAWPDAYYPRRQ